MNNFAAYLTPEQAFKQYEESNPDGSPFTLNELKEMARDTSECENCDNPVWRMTGLGMCFTCVTGEADASDDYELKLIK